MATVSGLDEFRIIHREEVCQGLLSLVKNFQCWYSSWFLEMGISGDTGGIDLGGLIWFCRNICLTTVINTALFLNGPRKSSSWALLWFYSRIFVSIVIYRQTYCTKCTSLFPIGKASQIFDVDSFDASVFDIKLFE